MINTTTIHPTNRDTVTATAHGTQNQIVCLNFVDGDDPAGHASPATIIYLPDNDEDALLFCDHLAAALDNAVSMVRVRQQRREAGYVS